MAGDDRYARQIVLDGFGKEGQGRLERAAVVVVGCGGLGTHAAELLVRAGIGRVILIDNDVVEISNLQRQGLYTMDDIGRPKAIAAAGHLKRINPDVESIAVAQELTDRTLSELEPATVVMDCVDNLGTRYLIDGWCRDRQRPWVHAACVGYTGEVRAILPGAATLRGQKADAEPERDPAEAGILATLPAMTAAIAATLAMRIILGDTPDGKLLRFDIRDLKLSAYALGDA